jgi:hypothetical protein
MHTKGFSGAEKNDARAHELAAAGAALGCSDSKGVLGYVTYAGCGVPQNKQIGERLMRESADEGSAWGQRALGLLHYDCGTGVALDLREAARYFRMAAEQGHSEAQIRLGEMYEYGRGVARDLSEAARYLCMAADQGHSEAKFNLSEMYRRYILELF